MTNVIPELKTIVYRGGLVRFSIPATWQEEYEPDGGGTFYKEGPDTGTLRLILLYGPVVSGFGCPCPG